jgi:hypothetical protein
MIFHAFPPSSVKRMPDSDVTVAGQSGQFKISGSHNYATAGSYPIAIEVTHWHLNASNSPVTGNIGLDQVAEMRPSLAG